MLDTHALLLQLLQTVLELGIGILVPVAFKFLMTKINMNKLVQNKAYASIAVQAVQQTMASSDAEAKKTDAERRLSALSKGALSPDEIDSLLHDAVFTLKQQIGHSVQQMQAAPAPQKQPIGFVQPAPTAAPEVAPAPAASPDEKQQK